MNATADRETLYRFFALPAAAAHESWLSFIPSELLAVSRRTQLGVLLLSRMLARRAALPPPASMELPEEHRWVLQDAARLGVAALQLGAIAIGPQVAASIQRDRVRLLRTALGEDLYRGALSLAASPLANVSRAALDACTTPEAVRNFVERAGMTLMIAILPQDEALRRVVGTKFPRSHVQAEAIAISGIDTQAVLSRLNMLLQAQGA